MSAIKNVNTKMATETSAKMITILIETFFKKNLKYLFFKTVPFTYSKKDFL